MDPLGDLLSFRTPGGHLYEHGRGIRELRNRAGYRLARVTPQGRMPYGKTHIRAFWLWDVFDPAGMFITTEPNPRCAVIAAVNHFMGGAR